MGNFLIIIAYHFMIIKNGDNSQHHFSTNPFIPCKSLSSLSNAMDIFIPSSFSALVRSSETHFRTRTISLPVSPISLISTDKPYGIHISTESQNETDFSEIRLKTIQRVVVISESS